LTALLAAICSATVPGASPGAKASYVEVARPSRFDFIVLASIAASPRPLSMSGYHPVNTARPNPALSTPVATSY
jgi:hypothetical protein